MKWIEFGIKYIWPIRKRFIRNLARRCSNCILSEKFTAINNRDGLCKFCRGYNPNKEKLICRDYIEVKDVIESYINFRHQYDALLLLSGGKDSAFVLLKLREKIPHLRILCILVDNGFTNPISINNAIQISRKMSTDLIIVSSFQHTFYGRLKRSFLNIKKEGCYSVIDYIDGYLIHDISLDIAKRFNIKLVISGLSKAQLRFINNVKEGFQIESDMRAHQIFPLASWNEDENTIYNEIVTNNLIDIKNISPIATNSMLILPMCVLDIMRLGYVSFEPEFAQQVRDGKANRTFWLNAFQWMEYYAGTSNYIRQSNEILKPLNITIEQILEKNK